MNFHTLPIDCTQDPGSVVAFCSRLLPHEVEVFKGNRTSFVWSSKDVVAAWTKTPLVPFCREESVCMQCSTSHLLNNIHV